MSSECELFSFRVLCSKCSGHYCTYWVVEGDSKTPICIRHDASRVLLNKAPYSRLCSAAEEARKLNVSSVRISKSDKISRYTISSRDELTSSPFLVIPEVFQDLPVYPVDQLTPIDAVMFAGQGDVTLVEVDGEQLVYKSSSKGDLRALQCEVDNIARLRDSPHIISIHAFVSLPSFEIINHCVQPTTIIGGTLIPFVGALSTLWYLKEWNQQEKEFLAVSLIDAVAELENEGVYLTDLKGCNVLLTKSDLKLIDLDTTKITDGYDIMEEAAVSEPSPASTTFNLGMALSELFSETTPPKKSLRGMEEKAKILVLACMGPEYRSVNELRQGLKDVLGRMRDLELSIAELVERRESRIRAEAASEEQAWLGQLDGKRWRPSFSHGIRPLSVHK
jgi:hypothetical protein